MCSIREKRLLRLWIRTGCRKDARGCVQLLQVLELASCRAEVVRASPGLPRHIFQEMNLGRQVHRAALVCRPRLDLCHSTAHEQQIIIDYESLRSWSGSIICA